MTDTIFSRVLACLLASGPKGIRTDVLAAQAGAKPMVLNNYLKRHRASGVEIHTLVGLQGPAALFIRRDWYEAARLARNALTSFNHRAKVRAREKEKRRIRAKLRNAEKAELAAKRLLMQPNPPKPPAVKAAKPATAKTVDFGQIECTGDMPEPVVLPHAPFYSRHQLAALPPGFKSPLSPAECRPWAACVGDS